MIRKIIAITILPFAIVAPALAHVTVKPSTVTPAEFQTFTMGVLVEKEVATTSVRLVVPEGLNHVTPTVKPGWTIEIKSGGEAESARVTEVIWSGGSIPTDQRDDFSFSAQAPANEGELIWKAYQTYADGTVVAWEDKPAEDSHDKTGVEESKPYSITTVTESASAGGGEHGAPQTKGVADNAVALTLSLVALALSIFALGRRKK